MLAYNEIKPKKTIILDGEPYEVIAAHIFRKQQRKPVNQTKLKNLKTGKVVERPFHQSETAIEAELIKTQATYLFSKPSRHMDAKEYWFCKKGNPRDRFFLEKNILGTSSQFLKENTDVEMLLFDDEIIGIMLPIKMSFTVKEAPPAIKGNTAQGGTKQIILETGAVVNVPIFINEGDKIIINTNTGEYDSRVQY